MNRISVNENNISANQTAILNNSDRISNNTDLILRQLDGYDKAISGVSIALAMPDAYLGNHENFAVAGGVGLYDEQPGVAFSMMARGREGWSFGVGVGTANGEVASKVQARWATP